MPLIKAIQHDDESIIQSIIKGRLKSKYNLSIPIPFFLNNQFRNWN